jgi:hypothetical protein
MSWTKVLICGVVASAAAVGCKVTVNDCSNGGCPDAAFGTGGAQTDSGTGGTTSTGGAGGTAGTGGSSGSAGTSSSGGTGGSGGTTSSGGSGGVDSGAGGTTATTCHPEEDQGMPCAMCIETKCCSEWLDCVNDADCDQTVSGKPSEFTCIQNCLTSVDSGVMTVEDCAGSCAHDGVAVSSATSDLIACTRDMGDSGTTQKCTNECFQRDLP